MIYLRQDFNIHPATPATRDRFIELAREELLPGYEGLGARLLAAWYNNAEWFSQITHILEFDDLSALERYRTNATRDAAFCQAQERVAALAPERREELLEPLGPVPEDAIHKAIEKSREDPAEVYSFAILDVEPGQMEAFCKLLGMGAAQLPIIASWKPVAGSAGRVIDVWRGDVQQGYAPTSDALDAFFTPLRETAAREYIVRHFPLPYSPLA
jgi:hypothetical protein